MTHHARDFIKSSGFLVVGVAAVGRRRSCSAASSRRRAPVRIPIPTSGSSIRGSSSVRTTPRRSSSARPISARAPARRSARSWPTSSTCPTTRTSCVMGSTDVTVDQGGSGGSDALQTDGYPMRRVAAEARRVLLEMAQRTPRRAGRAARRRRRRRFGRRRSVAARHLRRADRRPQVQRHAAPATTSTRRPGAAPIKTVQQLKIVGQSPQRYDIPAKVDGSLKWAVDAKVPGMLHARNVKPPVAGATLVSIDESSVKSVPGLRQGGQQGQLRRGRVRARGAGDSGGASAQGELAEAGHGAVPLVRGSVPLHAQRDADHRARRRASSAIRTPRSTSAAKVVEADYEVPFQGHTSIGPAHAMADPSNDQLTIYSNDMKSYGLRNGVAQFLQDAARSRARRLDGRTAGLRPHRGRRCRVRGGVSGEGARPAGARAVDAQRGNRVGHEGAGVHRQDARRARRAGQSRRARLRRARGRLTIISATTSPTPC